MEDASTSLPKIGEDAIVISGISGLFPSGDNILELSEKLYNKVDMVTRDVYPDVKHPELPQHYGKINGTTKFDSQFFRVTPKQSISFEPVGRKIMEQAYSAIFDAGVNPETLKGTKLGVFVGFSQSDTVVSVFRSLVSNGFIISGCSKTMLANRVSYWIDAKGPSFSMDLGCASSMACLEIACERMMGGDCDSALVAGCSYNHKPILSINMKRAGFLCLDGNTKCFDKNGDGYVRSEAVSVLFLQKARDAKRIYSEICHVKGKYFSKPDSTFLPTRNSKDLQKFFEEFYSEINVNPDDVEYIEANAPGILESDRSELEAISQVFGKNDPVKIGCVKSNLGHTESASGVVGISKICLAYQRGELPANINLTEPLDILTIRENKLQVITNNTNFNRGYTAVNNFSYTGANFHALLKCPYISKNIKRYNTEIPRLVLVSGRTEKGVTNVFDFLEKNPIDPEQIALINNTFKYNIAGHTGRGFVIFDNKENGVKSALSRSFEYYSGIKRPVCFMYSGMGSQWAGMGAQLMQIPIFFAAIKKCHKILEPKGLDLMDIITNAHCDIANNVIYSLTGITAVQIGLTDVLKALKIEPDLIIGHSLGEIACSYADGSLTAEEAILVSYYRGLVSAKTEFIKGKMAAIGLGYKELQVSCPADIDIACHNSSISTTISGPADAVDKFVESLTHLNIFAKVVASSDIAFHSRYIAEAGPKLVSLLHDIIKEPKQRSKKWLSTCYIPEEWDLEKSQFASAEYFTHNLLNKVLFEEAAKNIPYDAIIIEISPYGLLQAILKKSHASCLNISLIRRNNNHNIKVLLESIGKLYQNGLNPEIDILYPKIEFPVSTETPGLSHLVDWQHSVEWDNNYYINKTYKRTAMCAHFALSLYDPEYSFIKNYVRNGENILPESTLLVLVWKTLAMYKEVSYTDLPVEFNDIKFHEDIITTSKDMFILYVSIQKGSEKFEVTLENRIIVSGYIQVINSDDEYTNNGRGFDYDQPCLDKNIVHKLLSIHGYNIGEELLSIKTTNLNKCQTVIEWSNDWISFLNSLIQLNNLAEPEYIPNKIKFISSLHIDVKNHTKSIIYDEKHGKEYLYAYQNAESRETLCGGVICKSIVFKKIPLKLPAVQMLTQQFVPHFCNNLVDVQTAITINLQIVFENSANEKLKLTFIETKHDEDILNKFTHIIMSKTSGLDAELDIIKPNDIINENLNTENIDVVICSDFWNSEVTQQILLERLHDNCFIMIIENKEKIKLKYLANNRFAFISKFNVAEKYIFLMRKKKEENLNNYVAVSSPDHLKSELQKENHNVAYILENEMNVNPTFYNGNDCEKSSKKRGATLSIFDIDEALILLSTKNTFLKEQVEKGLTVNILRNKQSWGGYYHIPVKPNVEARKSNVELVNNLNNFEGFEWIESPTMIDFNTVEVHYSGILLTDCEDLLKENKNSNFGMDFSGIDSNGKQIMGCVSGGSIASSVQIDSDLLWPVPKYWSLEDAATVPLPYVHAYYCLSIKYKLLRRTTVLVTGGAGALGQALISLCLSLDCKVFATVGNKQKKKLLLKLFPQLKETNLELSVNTEFSDNIIKSTNGKRCKVVINCYSGKIREAAMACVAEFGIFLDISQDDMKENELFGYGYMLEGKNYATVRLSSIFTEKNKKIKKKLQAVVAEGIAKGVVKPLTRVVYPMTDVSKAFKLVSERKQVGRILVNMKDGISQQIIEPRLQLNYNKVYLVVWDGSEIGVELINRLITRGAKTLVINKGQESINSYFEYKYKTWKQCVKIEITNENLNTAEGCKTFISSGTKMGTVDGLIIIKKHCDECNGRLEHIPGNIVVSNLDFVTREIVSLRYFVYISFTPYTLSDILFAVTHEYFTKREKLGLPSQHIICKYGKMDFSLKTVLTFLNGFEKSLKQKYNNILLTDPDINQHDISVVDLDVKRKLISENRLNIFVDDIENEEIQATEVILPMKTLISEADSDEILFDPNEDMIMIITGFLGNYKTLYKSVERLKISAYGIQIAPDLEGSILDLAKNLLKYVKMRFKLKSKFYIVAHSFGVNVALEMGALLEKEGYHGIIFCLDSSPLELQCQIKAYLGNLTEHQLQKSIIQHIYSLITGSAHGEFENDLEYCENLFDKTTVFINNIKHKVSHSHQYLRDLISAVYKRIHLAMAYKPDLKLNSEIVLIKGLPDSKIDKLPDDYDLSKYTSKPVKVLNVTSDNVSLPHDPNISSIINGMLEPELLELYEKKNLCEIYFN